MTKPYLRLVLAVLALSSIAHADWKDDVGYTRLLQTYASGVPTAVSAGVTQSEASDTNGNYYLPDEPTGPTYAEFTGKTVVNKSTGTGVSGHAIGVGSYFYGNLTSAIPSTATVDSYNANNWIAAEGLNYGVFAVPVIEPRRVQNHSWISIVNTTQYTSTQIENYVTNIDQRLDYAINRDGFISVVGVNNGASTTLPALLCQSYHTLSVGLVSGNHSAGLTVQDGAGRMKPDLVSFEGVTSFSTPQVASAAGLISEKIRNTYAASIAAPADYPRLTRALILAGAAKEPLASWSRATTSTPYDATYGAGALNLLLSYRILTGGRQTASPSTPVAETGWDINTAATTTARTYFFDVPTGTLSPRFSAVLSWHRDVNAANFLTGSSSSLSNLNLELVNATGTTTGTQVDASISAVDNVEHVYQANLPPGRYALIVTSTNPTATAYALAWRTSPTVTVTATGAFAKESDGSPATFTITRTGPTTSPLLVPLNWSGTAVSGTHYITPPATLLIPAGSNSATVHVTPISDSIAQGDRTVSLTIATDYSLSAGAIPSASATIQDKPYDSWLFSHFTTTELADNGVSGPAADPDSDGLSNFMEYALNADPKTADATQHAPVAGLSSDHITLTYRRPASLADITYTVEYSDDLQAWSSGAAATETLSTFDNGDGTNTIIERSLAPLSSTPRQFLRLRITRL